MNQEPLLIWLQWYGNDDCSKDEKAEEVTWCQDNIFDTDCLYVRADMVRDILEGNAVAADAVRKLLDHSNSELTGG